MRFTLILGLCFAVLTSSANALDLCINPKGKRVVEANSRACGPNWDVVPVSEPFFVRVCRRASSMD